MIEISKNKPRTKSGRVVVSAQARIEADFSVRNECRTDFQPKRTTDAADYRLITSAFDGDGHHHHSPKSAS